MSNAFPRLVWALSVLVCFGLPGCNSGSDSGSEGGDGFTAKIEGKAWSAVPISISARVGAGVPGTLLMVGSATEGGLTRSLTITLYNVRGPGEYVLGVDGEIFGGKASVGEGTGSGGDAVTDGAFDLPYTGTYVPVPESKGSLATATLNKKPYTAASASALLTDFTGQPGIRITTINSENGYSLIMQGVTEEGSYPINNMSPNTILITGGRNGTDPETCCWQSANAGSTGTIVITEITATRVKGTFTGNLKPTAGKPATSDLLIEDGAFDIAVSP